MAENQEIRTTPSTLTNKLSLAIETGDRLHRKPSRLESQDHIIGLSRLHLELTRFGIKGEHHDLPTIARLGIQEHAVEAELPLC